MGSLRGCHALLRLVCLNFRQVRVHGRNHDPTKTGDQINVLERRRVRVIHQATLVRRDVKIRRCRYTHKPAKAFVSVNWQPCSFVREDARLSVSLVFFCGGQGHHFLADARTRPVHSECADSKLDLFTMHSFQQFCVVDCMKESVFEPWS